MSRVPEDDVDLTTYYMEEKVRVKSIVVVARLMKQVKYLLSRNTSACSLRTKLLARDVVNTVGKEVKTLVDDCVLLVTRVVAGRMLYTRTRRNA